MRCPRRRPDGGYWVASQALLHSRISCRLASGCARCASRIGRSPGARCRKISATLRYCPDFASSNARSIADAMHHAAITIRRQRRIPAFHPKQMFARFRSDCGQQRAPGDCRFRAATLGQHGEARSSRTHPWPTSSREGRRTVLSRYRTACEAAVERGPRSCRLIRTWRSSDLASFGKRADGPGGRRWLRRKWVRTAASAVFGDGATAVLIENLSLTGARLRGFGLPRRGKEVELKVG